MSRASGAGTVTARRRVRPRRATRIGAIAWLGVVAAVAVASDCVASSRPLACHRDGATTWFPNLGAPPAAACGPLAAGDWAVWPPIVADPLDVRSTGQIVPLAPPSAAHLLGTDDRGRDVAARLIHGTRASAITAAASAALALLIALVVGVLAVRVGGAARVAIQAMADVVATAPALVVAIAVQGLADRRGLVAVAVLIAVPRGVDGARLLIAQLAATLAQPYVSAARACGATPTRVLLRHAVPHAVPALAAATAITAATAILAEAALTFLGLGAAPPTPSWGDLLAQAVHHPGQVWLAIPVGIAITATTAALMRFATLERRDV